MLDRESYENLLREIAETGGPTDTMMELLQKLRDDFDEREGQLRAQGETKDKEPPATPAAEEKIRQESQEDNQEDGGLRRDPIKGYVRQEEYDDLKRRYIQRFFEGREPEDPPAAEEKPKGINDLFS